MQLNLTDEEVKALTLAIDDYYSGLREEIYHTDNYDARQTLKAVEATLAAVRSRLEPGWQAAPGYPADAGEGLGATTGQAPGQGTATPTTPDAAPQGTPPFGVEEPRR